MKLKDLEVVIGKSAKDNLEILRKARAWDIWMHFKDEPGAHLVIFRGRRREVTQNELQQIAKWFVSTTLKETLNRPIELIYTEERYVQPIKGDRLGRVKYQKEKVLPLVADPKFDVGKKQV